VWVVCHVTPCTTLIYTFLARGVVQVIPHHFPIYVIAGVLYVGLDSLIPSSSWCASWCTVACWCVGLQSGHAGPHAYSMWILRRYSRAARIPPLCGVLGRRSVMLHLFNQAAVNVSWFWLCCHVRCRRSARHFAFRGIRSQPPSLRRCRVDMGKRKIAPFHRNQEMDVFSIRMHSSGVGRFVPRTTPWLVDIHVRI
jgi:hypothetical protein